jgi:ribosomal protein S12 methylthiotransferase accessory factor
MLCEFERSAPVAEALGIIEQVYAREGLTAEFITGMGESPFPVHRCTVRNSSGAEVTHSSGKGELGQARASALFEAWQHLQHQEGQRSLPRDQRLRLMTISEVLDQPELHGEVMLRRLADDYPDGKLGCLPYQPIDAPSAPIWYPAFARNPAYRWHPAADDDLEYEPYLRYSNDSGTASGISVSEALLHGLLEVIERDSLSAAFLDWYLREPPRVRAVDQRSLPGKLRALLGSVSEFIGAPVLIADISTDIGVAAYAALPDSEQFPGSIGSGASLSPAYAAERSLTELAQAVHFARLAIDTTHQRRLENLRAWPFLKRCAILDKHPFRAADAIPADFTRRHPSAAVDSSIDAQIGILTGMLAERGFQAYFFSWTPAESDCPVVTVLVPGLDWFAMVHSATAVLPTGRAMATLQELRPRLAG